MRFAAEAWPWARLDEPRRASGSCSCQYVLLPRPVLGQASMSLEAPQVRARANTFASEAWPPPSLDELPSSSGLCSCQYDLPPRSRLG